MTMNSKDLVLALTLSCALVGCHRSNAAPGNAPSKPAAAAQGAPVNSAAVKVARIVFVGKEHACDCTRKTVDGAWAVLQKALGTPAKLPVERLHVDTETAKVEPYRQQKPIMALPAIYFVDSKNAVIEMLQGEVTAEQVGAALK